MQCNPMQSNAIQSSAMQYNNNNKSNNNNNFILCMQELDSLPRKIAGTLVVAGQELHIYLKTKKLNYYKALQIATYNK